MSVSDQAFIGLIFTAPFVPVGVDMLWQQIATGRIDLEMSLRWYRRMLMAEAVLFFITAIYLLARGTS